MLIKSTGEPTYRLPDIAYQRDKFDRGFDLMIDIFGADHMDAYPDVLSATSAMGYDREKVEVLIHQFVTVTKNNTPIKMTTRKANFISFDCKDNSNEVFLVGSFLEDNVIDEIKNSNNFHPTLKSQLH